METNTSRHILFLVGMHRSGTSALSAALHACGASFGSGLLQPMEGVNARGFWESAEVVELNERLLSLIGTNWFSVNSVHLQVDWTLPDFDAERIEAAGVLQRGFGAGPLEVVKDPRLCITLPFWLALCKDMELRTSVCVMTRAPVEVCRSLEERDAFPIGYGIRLLRTYLRGIAASEPPGTLYATYERLLASPVDLLHELEASLPLTLNEQKLLAAVLVEMKHQRATTEESAIGWGDGNTVDLEWLDSQIDDLYPIESALAEMADKMVFRGRELTRIGEAHTKALQTLVERDADVKRLSEELTYARSIIERRDSETMGLNEKLQQIGNLHTQAMAVVNERDRQLKKFDTRLRELGDLHSQALLVIEERDEQQAEFCRRLSEIGELHTKAIRVIGEKDASILELARLKNDMERELQKNNDQLQRIFQKPGVGRLFRAIWKHETC